ncbi:MAG TPA: TetR/AcrR family transcriptional regulator [Actinomycetota bacterium]|nr:TetR/AcrR family transcriptional regulator [Actinomycetota bacterium]
MRRETTTAGGVKTPTAVGAARKDQILQIAAELFSRRGYHATSMRDLAEGAGLLPGSLYAHFTGKEEILYQIVLDAARQFLGGMEALRAQRASPEEKFRRAMRAHVAVVAHDLEGARVFLHEWKALGGSRLTEIRDLRRRYEELWDEIIRHVAPSDSKLARLLALSAANWTYVWYDPNGPLGPEEIADRFSDLLLDGLRTSVKGKVSVERRVRS